MGINKSLYKNRLKAFSSEKVVVFNYLENPPSPAPIL